MKRSEEDNSSSAEPGVLTKGDYQGPLLVSLVDSGQLSDSDISFAAEALGRVADCDLAVPLLLRLLQHPVSSIREGAVYGIEHHLPNPLVTAALQAATEDQNPAVAQAARDALLLDV